MISKIVYFILWFSVWNALRRPASAADLIVGVAGERVYGRKYCVIPLPRYVAARSRYGDTC